jgi:hypothetical protein
MCAVQLIFQSILGIALWLRVRHIHRRSAAEKVESYEFG